MMSLVSITKFLLAIIACQYISNNYFSMLEVQGYYTYLWVVVKGHGLYRSHKTEKEDNTSEKEDNSDKFRENLDTFIYKIGYIIIISVVIEILSGIYFSNEIIQTFKHFDEQGITSAKLFNGRCSGAYYYKYNCDQKELAKELNRDNVIIKTMLTGVVHEISYKNFRKDSSAEASIGDLGNMNYYDDWEYSGVDISCSPGHSKKLKEKIVKYKWDGPIPVHNEDDCKNSARSTQMHTSSFSN